MGGEHGEEADEDEDEGEDAGRGCNAGEGMRAGSLRHGGASGGRKSGGWPSPNNTSLTRLLTLQEFDALTAPTRQKHQAVLRSSKHISIRTPVVSEHQRCNPVSFPFSKSFI